MSVDESSLPRSRAEAKELGAKRYFTGTHCRNGHLAERITRSGQCAECVREQNRRRYEKDRPGRIQAAKNWRHNNKDRKREYDAERYRTNPKVQQQVAEWRLANPDKVRESRVKWKEMNPEKHKEAQRKWASENPESVQSYVRERRARRRNAEGSHTSEDIQEILERQNFKCAECGKSVRNRESRQVDHIMPLKLGGSNWPTNLQVLCTTCNKVKGAKHPLEFARKSGRLV